MADSFNKSPIGSNRISGYRSTTDDPDPSFLAPPSQNCLVTKEGKAESRLGYYAEFSIGVSGSPSTCFYLKTYDIGFFALGTKVYYRDFSTGNTYDTGITLTTGTVTRFSEFLGDVYLTNTTDGPRRIVCGRLNGAASLGAATVTTDLDFAVRLSVFSIGATGSIVINGTSYAYNATDITTGVVTLNAVTLSAAYPDNTLIIRAHDISGVTGIEKPSKIEFWKSALHTMGFPSVTNVDQPNNSVIRGQFVIGQTAATGIENIIDFTYGTAGSTKIVVGQGGKLTNILGVDYNFWFFTEDQTFNAASSSINAEVASTASPGSALGLTIPILRDKNHGCLNEDCAIAMGSGEMAYITNDRRIIRQSISTDTGAAVSYPDEAFDVDIREHLKNMDNDQTGALAFHYKGQRKSIFQVKENGLFVWHIFDHTILRNVGQGLQKITIAGAWQPPQYIAPVTGFFERNGVLYGTDATTDTVYSFFTTFTDNNSPINWIIATGDFNVGNAMMAKAQVQGEINQPEKVRIKCYVTSEKLGRRSGSEKIIDGSKYSYDPDFSIGAVPIGDGSVLATTTQIAKWKREFDIFPSRANNAQLILRGEEDGGYGSMTAFSLTAQQYTDTFSPSL